MNNIKKFYKNNRIYCILMGVSIFCLALIAVLGIVYFVNQTKNDKYGDRLNGIESVQITDDHINEMVSEIEGVDGVDFVLSFSKLKSRGITENMLSSDIVKIFESDKYQMLFLNSYYDIATDELNNQVSEINNIIKTIQNTHTKFLFGTQKICLNLDENMV